MKLLTKKGEHSCKCTELSLKRKEGIIADMITPNKRPYSTFYYERKLFIFNISQSVTHTIFGDLLKLIQMVAILQLVT